MEKENVIDLEAAVVMPDHLHFVAGLNSGALSGLIGRFKGFTSKQIKSHLNSDGRIWQSQYHDHAIRTDEVLRDVVIYCLNNPVRAELVGDFHEYPYWYCKYRV